MKKNKTRADDNNNNDVGGGKRKAAAAAPYRTHDSAGTRRRQNDIQATPIRTTAARQRDGIVGHGQHVCSAVVNKLSRSSRRPVDGGRRSRERGARTPHSRRRLAVVDAAAAAVVVVVVAVAVAGSRHLQLPLPPLPATEASAAEARAYVHTATCVMEEKNYFRPSPRARALARPTVHRRRHDPRRTLFKRPPPQRYLPFYPVRPFRAAANLCVFSVVVFLSLCSRRPSQPLNP